jgi:hypothetical protein
MQCSRSVNTIYVKISCFHVYCNTASTPLTVKNTILLQRFLHFFPAGAQMTILLFPQFYSRVLQVCDQCSGSLTFPYPDPALFASDPQDANIKYPHKLNTDPDPGVPKAYPNTVCDNVIVSVLMFKIRYRT